MKKVRLSSHLDCISNIIPHRHHCEGISCLNFGQIIFALLSHSRCMSLPSCHTQERHTQLCREAKKSSSSRGKNFFCCRSRGCCCYSLLRQWKKDVVSATAELDFSHRTFLLHPHHPPLPPHTELARKCAAEKLLNIFANFLVFGFLLLPSRHFSAGIRETLTQYKVITGTHVALPSSLNLPSDANSQHLSFTFISPTFPQSHTVQTSHRAHHLIILSLACEKPSPELRRDNFAFNFKLIW